MSIKIHFRKEVDVDLNAYYPSLPGPLRKEIDDAIYKLLGGGQPKTAKAKAWKKSGPLHEDDVLTPGRGTPRTGTKTAAVMAELRRELNDGKLGIYTFTYGKLKEALRGMEKNLDLSSVSSWPYNLLAHKHIVRAK